MKGKADKNSRIVNVSSKEVDKLLQLYPTETVECAICHVIEERTSPQSIVQQV
jgi:hypothetical protein